MKIDELSSILRSFGINDQVTSCQTIHDGFINDTYLVTISATSKYILQGLNTQVFKDVQALQSNIDKALKLLYSDAYTRLEFITSTNGSSLVSVNTNVWRLMKFIPNSQTFSTTTSPKVAFEAGRVIGTFHKLLENEDPNNYNETLPDFHYLPYREQQFLNVLDKTPKKLISKAKLDIEFANNTLPKFQSFYQSSLQLRICHNDTKLNNILFDDELNGLCLIDLDTIMKGYFHYDFGDAVRTIANASPEDEKDLKQINFNLTLFKKFVEGIKASGVLLTPTEIGQLPLAIALMPFLHGLRALTDYLQGNVYYKVSYQEQNLDRCRALFEFTRLVLLKQRDIKLIVCKELK